MWAKKFSKKTKQNYSLELGEVTNMWSQTPGSKKDIFPKKLLLPLVLCEHHHQKKFF